MKFRDILNFDKMLTPLIIKIVYYIGIAGSIIGGIVVFFSSVIGGFASDSGFTGFLGGLIGGALDMVLGIFSTRIYSELMIVIFQINRNLAAIKKMMVNDVKVVVEDKPLSE